MCVCWEEQEGGQGSACIRIEIRDAPDRVRSEIAAVNLTSPQFCASWKVEVRKFQRENFPLADSTHGLTYGRREKKTNKTC